ncbi:helix-turn-helix domain-containing protein [Thalassotalea euphylliae]|uniref:helix-turn-helix domain-containing protein n=1 Tax=Thalassotalea euphylliae TaxID=1655234 RepID=UPI003627DFDC
MTNRHVPIRPIDTSMSYFMTVKEVAAYLSVSVQMVTALIKDGVLTEYKIRGAKRVRADELEAYVQTCAVTQDYEDFYGEDNNAA